MPKLNIIVTIARTARTPVACFVLLASVASACSDGASPGPTDHGGGPLFVLWSGVSSPEVDINYFTPFRSLEAGAEVDYGKAIEQPGVARLYGQEGIGYFALGAGENQTITRYDLGPGDAFVEGDRLSLAGFGVKLLPDASALRFVSATKAYMLDQSQLQVLEWNPAEMTVRGSMSIGALARDGAVPSFSTRSVMRGNQLVFAAGWYDPDYTGVQPGISLVTIDVDTGAVVIQPPDDRCRDPGELAEAPDGSLYVFSNYTNVLGSIVTGHGGPDCVLRVLAGANAFDPSYVGSMQSALGGRLGVVIAQRDQGTLWALAVDPALSTLGPGSTIGDFFGAAVWRWHRVDFPSLAAAAVDGQRAPTAYNGSYFRVGGRLFVSEASADFSRSTLLDVSTDAPVPGVSFPGFAGNVLRVR